VEDVILAGDVDVGDVIMLPGADELVLVSRVRLGQGGLIFTVAPAGGDAPEEDRPVKLTAEVRLRKRGRDLVLAPHPGPLGSIVDTATARKVEPCRKTGSG
jgi:hypothetical protein